jgi:hypothetical protein
MFNKHFTTARINFSNISTATPGFCASIMARNVELVGMGISKMGTHKSEFRDFRPQHFEI